MSHEYVKDRELDQYSSENDSRDDETEEDFAPLQEENQLWRKIMHWKSLWKKKHFIQMRIENRHHGRNGQTNRRKHALKRFPVSKGYCLWIDGFDEIMIPKKLVRSKDTVNFRVQLTFYDCEHKMFFGRTFHSRIFEKMSLVEGSNPPRYNVNCSEPLFFYSDYADSNIIVIVEIVARVLNEGLCKKEFVVGWSYFPIFEKMEEIQELGMVLEDLNPCELSDDVKFVSKSLYKGTARSLFLAFPGLNHVGSHAAAIIQSQVRYQMFHHSLLKDKKICHYIHENVFTSCNDEIPGIIRNPTMYFDPKFTAQTTIIVKNLKIELPYDLEVRLIRYMEETRQIEQGNQLNHDLSVGIFQRALKVGIHNGCSFIQPYGLPRRSNLVPSKQIEESGAASELALVGSMEFPQFVQHEDCALLFQLEYDIGVPVPIQCLTKKVGGIFGLFAKKTVEDIQPEDDYKVQHISIGQYIVLPFSDGKLNLSEIVGRFETGPGISYFGDLIFSQNPSVDLNTRKNQLNIRFEMDQKGRKAVKIPINSVLPPVEPEVSPEVSKEDILNQIKKNIEAEEKKIQEENAKNKKKDKINGSVKNMTPQKSVKNMTPQKQEKVPKTPKKLEEKPSTPKPRLNPQKIETPKTPTHIKKPTKTILEDDDQFHQSPRKRVPELTLSFEPPVDNDVTLEDISARSEKFNDTLGMTEKISDEELLLQQGKFDEIVDCKKRIISSNRSTEDQQDLLKEKLYIQFVAFKEPKVLLHQHVPKALYFEFSLFDYSFSSYETPLYYDGERGDWNLFHRRNESGDGIVSEYEIDFQQISQKHKELYDFYLGNETLHINVFDADSTMLYGVIDLDLSNIQRKNTKLYHVHHMDSYDIQQPYEETKLHSERISKGGIIVRMINTGDISTMDHHKLTERSFLKPLSRKVENIIGTCFANSPDLKSWLQKDPNRVVVSHEKLNYVSSLLNRNEKDQEAKKLKQRSNVLQLYRESKKEGVIASHISNLREEKKWIDFQIGSASYFYIMLSNLSKKDKLVDIESSSEDICIVQKPEELAFLSQHEHSNFKCTSHSPTDYEVKISSNQVVKIFFKIQTWKPSIAEDIYLFIKQNGIVFRKIHIHTNEIPQIFHRNLEYALPSMRNNVISLYLDDPTAHVASDENITLKTNREADHCHVQLHLPSQPHMSHLNLKLYIYSDHLLRELKQIYKIKVSFMKLFSLKATLGQRSYFENNSISGHVKHYLKHHPSSQDEQARIYSSHDRQLKIFIDPKCPLRNLSFFKGFFRPLPQTNVKGYLIETILVKILNSKDRTNVASYLFETKILPPRVNRKYEERIKLNGYIIRQLVFVNPHSEKREFIIGSNYPHLVRFNNIKFSVEPHQKHKILVRIDGKGTSPETKVIYIFVNYHKPHDDSGNENDLTLCCFEIDTHFSRK